MNCSTHITQLGFFILAPQLSLEPLAWWSPISLKVDGLVESRKPLIPVVDDLHVTKAGIQNLLK
jgi:hypothetical protein